MLYLLKLKLQNPLIIASRNSHKAFITAVALLDLDVIWLESEGSYLSCVSDISLLEKMLIEHKDRKKAVYITTPDYLGNKADVKAIASVCKRHNSYLCVDNAHGAYLKFLKESEHPIDLGADMCCSSAHKTLPVITGGAYLHIAKSEDGFFERNAKDALSLFGSTSPSYLILQSLDHANFYLSNGYKEKLSAFLKALKEAKKKIASLGFTLCGNDELKIVIASKSYGYFGFELAKELSDRNIICEFYDRDHLVMMLTPENGIDALGKIIKALSEIPRKERIDEEPPKIKDSKSVLSVRDAVFSESEVINASESEGRVLSQQNIACPPAVPIIVCGERITKDAVECFRYYNIDKISVIK
jgi:arginine/lysine/ornithine decarboxylase